MTDQQSTKVFQPDRFAKSAVRYADFYFREAVNSIEREFGEGAAKQFPDLIAAFMRAASYADRSLTEWEISNDRQFELEERLRKAGA